MIKRVKIKGYKSLDDLEVNLEPLTVIFGSNSAGKSNFLDVLQLISKIPFSSNLKQAFDPPYRGKPLESFTFPNNGIEDLLKEKAVSFSIEIDIYLSENTIEHINQQIIDARSTYTEIDGKPTKTPPKKTTRVTEKNLRYRIEIEINPETGFMRVKDEFLAALNSRGDISRSRSPFFEKVYNKRINLRMEGQAHPKYKDLYLPYSILTEVNYAPHYPHITAFKYELSKWFFYYFEPRERMRIPNSVKEVRHIGLMGEELASFLNTLKASDPKQFKALNKAIKMIIPSVDGIDVLINNRGEVELNIIENGKSIPSSIVSEGTLRIIGLLALWGAQDPPSVVGFEEPENGIHPRRIKLIAELLENKTNKDSQFIVTTHSPILPDYIDDKHLFVCKKTNGKTEISPFTDWGPLLKKVQFDNDLNEEYQSIPKSNRILRGDFE